MVSFFICKLWPDFEKQQVANYNYTIKLWYFTLFMKKNIPENINYKTKTLIHLFELSADAYPDNPLFWEKSKDKYESTSYLEMKEYIYKFSCGLIQLGIFPGDKVALLAPGIRSWVISELGVLYSGAVNVPLSIKLESSEIFFRLKHSGAKMLITSKQSYLAIKDIISKLPELEKIVLIDSEDEKTEFEISLSKLYQIGEQYLKNNAKDFEKKFREIKENDPAIISYTSGTTADPKGIILSHKNLVTNCEQSLRMFYLRPTDKTLLILPLDHSFAHTTGMYVFIVSGASLASVQQGKTPNETLRNLQNNIREIKPDMLLSVPTLAKNLKKNIVNGIKKKGSNTERLFTWGLYFANKYIDNGWNRGRGYRILYKPIYKLFDIILFSKIRENFGGNLKWFVGGGALLDIELQKFFFAIGIPMYQGYGLSEAAPVISGNTVQDHKMGSSGKIVPNLEVKIVSENGNELPPGEKGEIVVRGDNVMLGYYRNQKATEESLKDGWLFTGDLGYFDEDGFLYVLGRFKSLLIADDGEKFSPEGIEENLVEKSKYINQVMVYNNQNKYTTALIFPDKLAIDTFLTKKGLDRNSKEGQNAAIELVQNQINEFKKGKHFEANIPVRWLPSTFSIIEEGFSEENHFLNSTLKMVRGKITEFYLDRIEFMYTTEGKDIFNHRNLEVVQNL